MFLFRGMPPLLLFMNALFFLLEALEPCATASFTCQSGPSHKRRQIRAIIGIYSHFLYDIAVSDSQVDARSYRRHDLFAFFTTTSCYLSDTSYHPRHHLLIFSLRHHDIALIHSRQIRAIGMSIIFSRRQHVTTLFVSVIRLGNSFVYIPEWLPKSFYRSASCSQS